MKKNAAVIGYGGMGGWHTQHLLESDVCNLAGIYDIKEERSELARSRGIRAYSSREELLSDPSIDMVTVAIPNDSHKEVVMAALDAGKNVICEKPVALSVQDLQDMIDCANRNHRLFSVHQNRRWDVDYLAMKQLHDSGAVGSSTSNPAFTAPAASPVTGEAKRSTAAACFTTGAFTSSTRSFRSWTAR